MKLKSGSSKSLTIDLQRECYTSINDMPIGVWMAVNETGDVSRIYKSGNGKITKAIERLWESIYDEFIRKIGFSPEYEEYLRSIAMKAKLQLDVILNPTPLNNVQLAQIEIQIDETSKRKGAEFTEVTAFISKHIGFRINPNEVTVAEYYAYKKLAIDGR